MVPPYVLTRVIRNGIYLSTASILPRPTQARNSGRAEQCWIAGVAGCHGGGGGVEHRSLEERGEEVERKGA